VLVAGLASALAGIFSMSAGEYMSSKSQREIFDAQIAREVLEVNERPGEAEAEVAYMLREEGAIAGGGFARGVRAGQQQAGAAQDDGRKRARPGD
jgi:VIT1/CCC1 family predicted Fe2+/Mn2+ transporter